MAPFFLGFLALAGFLGAAWWFSRQKTAQAARLVRMLLGGGALLAGALLTLRGAMALGAYGAPGESGSPGGQPPRAGPAMSLAEAREILSVGADATREDIRQAHRNLMKKLHPDTGAGSAALARQVQEARDILLAALDD